MNIGKGIVAVREKAGINQSQLAVRAGLSQTALSQIENGRSQPSRENLEKIATALNTDVAYISLAAINPAEDMEPDAAIRFNELFPNFHEKLLSFYSR